MSLPPAYTPNLSEPQSPTVHSLNDGKSKDHPINISLDTRVNEKANKANGNGNGDEYHYIGTDNGLATPPSPASPSTDLADSTTTLGSLGTLGPLRPSDVELAKIHSHPELEDHPAVASVEEYIGPTEGPGMLVQPVKFEYEIVKGFFVQNDPDLPRKIFEPELLNAHFGMVDTTPQRWANLDERVRALQAGAEEGVQYKVIFLARHGQGWHNVGSEKHGVEAWEAHWTFQRGDGELTWGPDPELSPEGIRQARAVHKAWKKEVMAGAPVSSQTMKWYVSPLTRTAQTMLETFQDLLTGTPETWEDWREIYGSHTCDERSSRSYIAKRFPMIQIEEGFSEPDPLWRDDDRETDERMQVRARRAFDRVFSPGGADETYVSITSHSAIIRNMLAVLGHHCYPLRTGEMIPMVLKATPVKR